MQLFFIFLTPTDLLEESCSRTQRVSDLNLSWERHTKERNLCCKLDFSNFSDLSWKCGSIYAVIKNISHVQPLLVLLTSPAWHGAVTVGSKATFKLAVAEHRLSTPAGEALNLQNED